MKDGESGCSWRRSTPWVSALVGLLLSASSALASEPDLPPVGRSLFDIVTTVETPDGPRLDVPFPFDRLRALIAKAGGLAPGDIAETLIPIGRSLQREAAAPDYFAFPRRVLGVTGAPGSEDPSTTLALKDRLYLGYQPRTNSIEVISFNETAGRFEFQIVEDYGAGRSPRVFQARRALCLGCHGNGGPIFPEAPWSETPANPAIAARLAEAGATAAPDDATLEQSRRAVAALHASVGGANDLSHASRYWAGACGDANSRRTCPAKLLSTALEHRLSGRRSFGKGDYQTRRATETYLLAAQDHAWPGGFRLDSPYIPDIDPLGAKHGDARDQADPLNRRPPLAILDVERPSGNDRIIDLLGDGFADRHVAWLQSALLTLAGSVAVPRRVAKVPCVFGAPAGTPSAQKMAFTCSSRVPGFPRMSGALIREGDTVQRLAITNLTSELITHTDIEASRTAPVDGPDEPGRGSFEPRDKASALHPRTGDGWVIRSIDLAWPEGGSGGEGMAVFTILHDIKRLRAAIGTVPGYRLPGAARSVADGGLRGADITRAIAVRLGQPMPDWCCLPKAGLPPPRAAAPPARLDVPGLSLEPGPAHPSLLAFHRACGACHAGAGTAPPNFLYGPSARQLQAIADCAPRILMRLGQWNMQADGAAPAPMPPPRHLASLGQSPKDWLASADYRRISRFAAALGSAAGLMGSDTIPEKPLCTPARQ